MLPAQAISKKRMAVNSPNHSFDDSLESRGNEEQLYPSSVASAQPEEMKSFSAPGSEPGSSYLNLIPQSDLRLLQDKTNGKNRALGVEKLQAAIESAKSADILESNLAKLVEDACAAVTDSHIKVSLAGLQLLEPLIRRTGRGLTHHLPSIVEAILGKMNSNKYLLKKAGMKVLKHLMHYHCPHNVMTEVAKFGLKHKHSKVREESLNVITAALLLFPRSEFRLKQVAQEIMPTMMDSRPRVRQACMECAAQMASMCTSDDFKEVVSCAIKNGHHAHVELAILSALEYRIVRESPPHLKEDGLIEYAMPVVGVDIPPSQHGPDVDWIRDATLPGGGNVSLGSSGGLLDTTTRREGKHHRPFCSASKRLPWEREDAERSRTTKNRKVTNKKLDPTATVTPNKTTPPRTPPSSKKLFPKDGSTSPPSHRPPSGKKAGRRTPTPPRSPKETGGDSVLLQDLRDMVPPPPAASCGSGPPLPPPTPLLNRSRMGTRGRHQSLPNGVASRDLNGTRKATNFGNGSPKLSPIGSKTTLISAAGDDQQQQQQQQEKIEGGRRSRALPSAGGPSSGGGEFSESWPRSRVGARGNEKAAGLTPRAPAVEQITVDPLKAAGSVNDAVRMSLHRPPSKPRVRHPITMIQRQEERRLKNTLLLQQQQQLQFQDSPQDSPTQTEKEFLMGMQDSYYDMVPEDTTVLDKSLSSSLSSLCPANKDTPKNIDSSHYTRKEEAASRNKAQPLSAERSLSNSLEHSQSTHDETPVGPAPRRRRRNRHETTITEAVQKRAKSGVRRDFTQTFTAGVSLAHVHPSAATWQDMQNLAQIAPVDTPPDKPRKKKKKRSVGSNEEGSGSLNGSDLTLEGGRSRGTAVGGEVKSIPRHLRERNGPPQTRESNNINERLNVKKPPEGVSRLPVLKTGLRKPGSLGPEGQRPTIERGGTNTIVMEVNGVKSPPPAHLSPEQLSPPVQRRARESRAGKKQRNSEPAFMFSETQTTFPPPGLSKPPQGFDGGSSGGMGQQLLPDVARQPRRKQSKYAVSSKTADDPPPYNGHRYSSVENGVGGGEGGSPGDSKCSLPVGDGELQPFANSDRGLHESLGQLDDSDWNKKCDGLLGVQRLAVFHTDKLLSDLHNITLAVVKEVQNLRSSVSRVAIVCLGDIFVHAGHYMDPELERVVRVLLNKAGESSVFIRDDVERTMTTIVQHATPDKLLHTLIQGRSHKNVQIRRTAAQFLGQTVERCGPAQLLHSSRDLLEKTLSATLDYITDAAAEPRYYGRKCLSHFMTVPEFEKIASRTLNSQRWTKMRDALETIRVKGVGEPPGEAAAVATRSTHPTGGTVRAASHTRGTGGPRAGVKEVESKPRTGRRVTQQTSHAVVGGENPPLPDRLVERLKANDWEDRQEAISVLERFVDQHPKALEPHMNKVFDAFNPRLTDRNSKVNLCALQAFSNMVPLLGNILAPLSANVIKALMPNLASKNTTIYEAATTVFDLISQCVDPLCLIQPIATHSQHGNVRVQPIMIRKLAELTGLIYSQHSKLVTRQVLPVMWHLLAGKPPGSNDAKEAIVSLCEALFNTMGQKFVDGAASQPSQCQRRLNQILNSGTFH